MRLRLGCVRALHEATLRQLTEREALPWVGKGTRGERRGHTGAALRRGGEQSSTRAGSELPPAVVDREEPAAVWATVLIIGGGGRVWR